MVDHIKYSNRGVVSFDDCGNAIRYRLMESARRRLCSKSKMEDARRNRCVQRLMCRTKSQ
jgi:hypothetical protein